MAQNLHGNTDARYGLFNDSFPPVLDGVTLTVQNYARWLDRRGMHPCVVTPWNPVRDACNYPVLRYFSLPLWGRRPYRYGYPKLDPFIWLRLRRTPFALVHSHCPFSSGRLAVYAARAQKVPLIGTFHSKYRSDLAEKLNPLMLNYVMKRIIRFFNACDEVWIPQPAVEETVREYGYKGRLTVVENGNDFASMSAEDLRLYRAASRQQLGYPPGAISLLFVGQHIHQKGVGLIIDALAKIARRIDFRMNFVGTGYAQEEMKTRVRDLGLESKVTFHGVVNDRERLRRIYAAADLFLFPSFYDNAPLVVREAAAMGTPSVLLRGSTASEVVSDGANGFLAGASAEDYAETIVALAADSQLLARVGAGAHATLVRSWEDVVDEVAERYRKIMRDYRKY